MSPIVQNRRLHVQQAEMQDSPKHSDTSPFCECMLVSNTSSGEFVNSSNPMVVKYRGRLIKADPNDARKRWSVYKLSCPGHPVLYFGITTNPHKRLRQHRKRLRRDGVPQPIEMEIIDGYLTHVDARRLEIDLHHEYPHARTYRTVRDHLNPPKPIAFDTKCQGGCCTPDTYPECPRCGGRLLLMNGSLGEFWGCKEYFGESRCGYTHDVDYSDYPELRKSYVNPCRHESARAIEPEPPQEPEPESAQEIEPRAKRPFVDLVFLVVVLFLLLIIFWIATR